MISLLADVIPAASTDLISKGVIAFAVAIYFVDRLVSIATNLRGAKIEVMPKAQLVGEIQRLELLISEVNKERREVSKELFDKIEQLGHSFSNTMSDLSRVIGRLEGSHQLAESIQSAIVTIAKQQNK